MVNKKQGTLKPKPITNQVSRIFAKLSGYFVKLCVIAYHKVTPRRHRTPQRIKMLID